MSANHPAIKWSSIAAVLTLLAFLYSWNDRVAAARDEVADIRRELSVIQVRLANNEVQLSKLESWRDARALDDAQTNKIIAQIGTDLAVLREQLITIARHLDKRRNTNNE